MIKYRLKLYVTGQTPQSRRAIDNLNRICEQELQGQYEIHVLDVLERPELAEDERILATPTVVKELPAPIRRIIGDLSDAEKVLVGLDLQTCAPSADNMTGSPDGRLSGRQSARQEENAGQPDAVCHEESSHAGPLQTGARRQRDALSQPD
jgi:circadian clock protein KaiB